jgi:hypothetical protein
LSLIETFFEELSHIHWEGTASTVGAEDSECSDKCVVELLANKLSRIDDVLNAGKGHISVRVALVFAVLTVPFTVIFDPGSAVVGAAFVVTALNPALITFISAAAVLVLAYFIANGLLIHLAWGFEVAQIVVVVFHYTGGAVARAVAILHGAPLTFVAVREGAFLIAIIFMGSVISSAGLGLFLEFFPDIVVVREGAGSVAFAHVEALNKHAFLTFITVVTVVAIVIAVGGVFLGFGAVTGRIRSRVAINLITAALVKLSAGYIYIRRCFIEPLEADGASSLLAGAGVVADLPFTACAKLTDFCSAHVRGDAIGETSVFRISWVS